MGSDPREANHDHFSLALQQAAQARAWDALAKAAAMIEPGMNDLDGKAVVDQVITESGADRLWHASQVRFGPNTVLPFGEVPAAPHVLGENDIFFLDIGPCYEGHEGDVGAGFTIGADPVHRTLIAESKAVFEAVKAHWAATGATGPELYRFARQEADRRGRTLALEGASGHRIGAFPHRVHHSGKLKAFDKTPSPACWILEIHVVDRTLGIGAFYEDML